MNYCIVSSKIVNQCRLDFAFAASNNRRAHSALDAADVQFNLHSWMVAGKPGVLGVPSSLADGFLQGATLNYGKRGMVMMGETGMLMAQLSGSGDLTTEIPCTTYKTPFGDMFLNVLLYHVPDEREPLLFRVESAVEMRK